MTLREPLSRIIYHLLSCAKTLVISSFGRQHAACRLETMWIDGGGAKENRRLVLVFPGNQSD